MTTHAPPASEDMERQGELASLRETVRDVCEAAGGTVAVRSLAADGTGVDARSWDVLARDIGLAGLGLPESAGGLGGLAELAAVAEELGRVLLPVPFLTSTVLAGQVLARVGAAGEAALERVAAGEVATLAATVAGAGGPAGRTPLTAAAGSADSAVSADGAGWTVNGTARHVPDGAGARMLVVAARTGDGVDLFLVEAGGSGVAARRVETLDLSRPQAEVVLSAAPARRLTSGGDADAVLSPALDVAAVVLAAEQLGGAQACLDMTVAYLKERRQFGRAIGSFQALKHTAADLLVLVETSRSAVVRAVDAEAAGEAALAEAAAVAQSWCSEAFRTVSAEAVQLHGGIGFTWEHDAHLYFRRARADAVLLGGTAHHRERLATLLGW